MTVPLYTFMPFSADRNLGKAYNEHLALLPDGAWGCVVDHDMHLLTLRWWHQLQEAIACRPDAGVFTCQTNRIAADWQRIPGVDRENHDIAYHHRIAHERLRVRTLLDITGTKGFGGVLMCLSKRAWLDVGGFVDGMFCVDHNLHFALRKAGYRNYLIEGLYIYHRRRAFGTGLTEVGPDAPVKVPCECRGPETAPTERIVLPELAGC